MTALIGLVSGTWNRLPLLKDMVQSFRDNLLPGIEYTITIIDGGSRDGTIKWCNQQSDIQLIKDGKLTGAISAFTRAAHATDAKYILLANDDIEFKLGSIIPAIVYLESDMQCGAVAFKDNRELPGYYTKDDYHTLKMAAVVNGRQTAVVYAQVGLFRKWLGERCNWWTGEHDEMIGAYTYAGDNMLSAQIWRYGYRVMEVPDCIVEDHVAVDGLRQVNYQKGLESNDSHFFYDHFPQGVPVMDTPQLVQEDRRAARILYLPIYEPGWTVQKHPLNGKKGLREALMRAKNKHGQPFIVQEFDYLAAPPNLLRVQLMELCEKFRPDLILTQLQSPQPITADMLAEMKSRTNATIINWNGDQALGGLIGREMLNLLMHVDLQLITNLDAAPDYDKMRIKWAYWQIGYEEPGDNLEAMNEAYFRELGRENPFNGYPNYPVVYLASLRSPERQAIAALVNEFGGYVFQPGDQYATLYNFPAAKYIYQHAKIAISDNGFTSRGFVSNRLFQALAAGGCCVFQQHVDGLDEMTGLKAGEHYIEWTTLDDLRVAMNWLTAERQREHVASTGTAFVHSNYSFDAQVAKLFKLIEEKLGENQQLNEAIPLKYQGRNGNGFGLGNSFPSGTRYEYTPGKPLYVHKLDYAEIMRLYPGQWERIE
jgi:glycosyl transferase family 2